MRWFRWYRGTSENPKFAMIAATAHREAMTGDDNRLHGAVTVTDVLAVWVTVLEDAGNGSHWGVCTKDAKFIAVVLRWWPEEVQNVLDAMVQFDMLEPLPEGGYRVAKWDEYQYTSDTDPTNAERQRRYRDRHKTDAKRARNGRVTRLDTDTDTDTEKKEAPAARTPRDELATVLDSEHVEAVIEHRKKKRCPLTAHAAKLLAAKFAKWTDPNAAADAMIANGWQGFEVEWMKNRTGAGPPAIANGPPPGFREAKSTAEYVAYMREKTGDPKLDFGDYRLSKYQYVPTAWRSN